MLQLNPGCNNMVPRIHVPRRSRNQGERYRGPVITKTMTYYATFGEVFPANYVRRGQNSFVKGAVCNIELCVLRLKNA